MALHPIDSGVATGKGSVLHAITTGLRSSSFFGAGDSTLLAGETDGLAIDFTATTDFALSTWAMQAVQERNSSVDTLQSPHVFFTQSGTSAKFVKTSSTGIGWSPHNTCPQSEDFATTWSNIGSTESTNSTTAPDGTSTADTITEDTGNTRHMMFQFLSSTVGLTYTFSVYAKRKDRQWASVSINDGTDRYGVNVDLDNGNITDTNSVDSPLQAVSSVTSVGNGWYRIAVSMEATNTSLTPQAGLSNSATPSWSSGNASYTGDGSSGIYLWGAQINRGSVATAYIKTTTAAVIGLPISYGEGLLVEPAATNLAPQSQTFDNVAWSKTNVTVTANDTTAPDGSTTADKAVESNTSNSAMVNGTSHTITAATYTSSAYVKRSNNTWLLFGNYNTDFTKNVITWFDIQNGTVGSTTNATWTHVSSTITSVGDGWYRIAVTFTSDTTTHKQLFCTATADGGTTRVTSGTYWVWGAQSELGTVATSYIPTVAATATRAADNVTALTSSFGYSATVGTAYISFVRRFIAAATADNCGLQIDDGTANERIRIINNVGGTSVIGGTVIDGGVEQLPIDTAVTIVVGTNHKASMAWQANNFAISADGGSVVTDAAGSLPTVTTLRLGNNSTPGFHMNGFLKKLVYVPRRVTDGDLPTWRYPT